MAIRIDGSQVRMDILARRVAVGQEGPTYASSKIQIWIIADLAAQSPD